MSASIRDRSRNRSRDRFLGQISVGTMPHEKVMRAIELLAIELLGTEVAPAVREEVATPKRGEHRADRLSTFDGN